MGCGASAAQSHLQAQSFNSQQPAPTLLNQFVPGQSAIIHDCPHQRLDGENVLCEKYNPDLGERLVEGTPGNRRSGRSRGGVGTSGHHQHQTTGATYDIAMLSQGAFSEALNEKLLQDAIEQSRKMHLLSELPRQSYNENYHGDFVECELCLCEYKEGDELMRLPCLHAFHSQCVAPWITKQATCPVCNTDVCQAMNA